MKINAYFLFDGNCREAAVYYGGIFGKTPEIMTYAKMPPEPGNPLPKEMENKILHAEIKLENGDMLMMSDNMPGMPYVVGNNISVAVGSKDQNKIQSLFAKLKEGSEVVMELQKTFWSPCFGELKDRFGISWLFNCDVE